MAIFKCQISNISRGKGKSAVAAAAYRSGSKFHDQRSRKLHNYSRKQVDHSKIIAPSDTPEWVYNREKLWNEVELIERRKDARLAKELLLALPVELNKWHQLKMTKNFIRNHCVAKGMIADLNFHDLESHNPHCHVMLTTRNITTEGFGLKNRDWNSKELVIGLRQSWQETVNQTLEQQGINARVSCQSNETQGIDRIPQIELSAAEYSMMKRGHLTYRAERYQKIKKTNQKIESLTLQAEALMAEKRQLDNEIVNESLDSITEEIGTNLASEIEKMSSNLDKMEETLNQALAAIHISQDNTQVKAKNPSDERPSSKELTDPDVLQAMDEAFKPDEKNITWFEVKRSQLKKKVKPPSKKPKPLPKQQSHKDFQLEVMLKLLVERNMEEINQEIVDVIKQIQNGTDIAIGCIPGSLDFKRDGDWIGIYNIDKHFYPFEANRIDGVWEIETAKLSTRAIEGIINTITRVPERSASQKSLERTIKQNSWEWEL